MEEDSDVTLERETKDFNFKQLKKIRVFDPPPDVPEDRSTLLAISNKYGLLFVGGPFGLKIYSTKDVLIPIQQGDDPNAIEAGPAGIEVQTKYPVHHVALSSDNLTLSVCMSSSECGCLISFFDTRTLINRAKQPKQAFASQTLVRDPAIFVTDLKWNPVAYNVAVCLSDGSISVLQVNDGISLFANLPAAIGVTSVCWSPKGKQLAVGKQDGTVVQYLPNLQEKKVIPCPPFYDSDNPVKVLDVLWISTYVFGVVYAAADGSVETSPQLVMVLLSKKDDKKQDRFLNFTEICFSSSNVRQHHFFLNYMEDWDVLLAASAASIEVSVIAKLPDQNSWELWVLEDSSRAELPVSDNRDDTFPMGVVVDYSNQQNVVISDDKIVPPTPIMVILSTDGVLCPFYTINFLPQAKSLNTPLEELRIEGERQPKASSAPPQVPVAPSSAPAAAITPAFTLPVSSLAAKTQPAGPAFSLSTTTSKPAAAPFSFGTTPFSAKPPDTTQAFASGAPAASFGSTAGGFGATSGTFGTPAASFGGTTGGFGAPSGTFGTAAASSGATSGTFGAPTASSVAPSGSFGAPAASSGAPAGGFSIKPGFGLPPPSSKPQVVSQPFGAANQAGKPSESAGFSFSASTSSAAAATSSAPSGFSLPPNSQGFGFSAPATPAFGAPSSKPDNSSNSSQTAGSGFGFSNNVKVNLSDKFGAVDSQPATSKAGFAGSSQSFSFSTPTKPTLAAAPLTSAPPAQPPAQQSHPTAAQSRTSQDGQPASTHKTPKVTQSEPKQTPHQPPANDPILNAINEEIAQFQKEMDDLKSRTAKTSFTVGTDEEMRKLKTECDGFHSFVLEIKDTTESLHGDVGNLKNGLLDAFSSLLAAKELKERKKDRMYHRLLCKRPLDPKSEELMQEIRRLLQYVTFSIQVANNALDIQWDQYLASRHKQRSLVIPQRHTLFIKLAEHHEVIAQQKQRLNELLNSLQKLRMYNQSSQWSVPIEDNKNVSFEEELEKLQMSLSKMDTQMKPSLSPKPQPKISKVKMGQLRNFLASRKITRVQSLAPVNLSRSSFLAPSYFEDLNDVSSTSSLSEAGDNEDVNPPLRQETPPPEPSPVRTARHAAVTRTASVQPGFATPAIPFGKTHSQMGPMTSTPAVPGPTLRVIPQGADSTMLATKTVKHGAPPVTATQAAAAAALRRHMTNQVPASLTETTLQNVPQVVNVKELKGNGPGPSIPTVIGPSVPQSAAQVVNQVLVTVGSAPAKQIAAPGGIKGASAAALPSNVTVQPGSGFVAGKTGQIGMKPDASGAPSNKTFPFSGPTGVFMGNVVPSAAPGSSLGAPAQVKDAFGSVKPSPVSTSATLTVTPTDAAASVKPTSAQAPTPTSMGKAGEGATPSFPGGETLGSFSGLRVGHSEEVSKTDPSKATPPAQAGKMPGVSPLVGFQASKASEPTSTNNSPGMLFGNKIQSTGLSSVFNPSASKQPFSFTPHVTTTPATETTTSAPTTQMPFAGFGLPSATSAAPSSVPVEAKQPAAEKPSSDPAAPPLQLQALLATPPEGSKEQASGFLFSAMGKSLPPGSAAVPPGAKSQPAPEPKSTTPPISAFPTPGLSAPTPSIPASSSSLVPSTGTTIEGFPSQNIFGKFPAPGIPSLFNPSGTKQPFSFTAPATTAPVAEAPNTATPTLVGAMLPSASLQPPTTAADPSTGSGGVLQPAPEKAQSDPATPPLQLQALLATPVEGNKAPAAVTKPQLFADPKTASPLVPPASGTTEGPSQAALVATAASTLALASTQMTSAGTTPPVSAFGLAPTQSASTAPSPFGQAPGVSTGTSLFGQPSTETSTPANATSGFGAPGFGQSATFGQTSFWKPASSSSGSSFTSGFGSASLFGQAPASAATTSSSDGSLFGAAANTSSASTFSFAPQPSSTNTSSTGGGLFGQSSTPAFGQSATFGQSAPVFGSLGASTTTTSSSGFTFGQQSGFGTSSTGFGQPQTSGTSVFGQQAAPSGGGLFGSSGTNTSGGGFFSGLGGKPSQEAANKNPFGTSSTGFGSPSSSGSTGLFGNSGAKAFGFGSSSFGEQKTTGTFSAGGSVASQGFGFSSPTKTGGFGAAPVFGSPPTFGGSPGFGGVPAFGSAPNFTSPLGSTGGKVFGEGTAAANTGGFGFGSSSGAVTFGSLASQNTPTFGSLSQQGSGFGGQSTGFSGFGAGSGGTTSGSTGGFPFGVSNQSTSAFGGGWRG